MRVPAAFCYKKKHWSEVNIKEIKYTFMFHYQNAE
jgi:hypothetical protein